MNDPIYRPGLEGIIAGETAVSSISDGLRYRGYSIEDLASFASFEEVAYLLLHGSLPDSEQLTAFNLRLAEAAQVDHAVIRSLADLPKETSLMDVLRTAASFLSHWDPDIYSQSREANLRKAERLIVQLAIVLAARVRICQSQDLVEYDHKLSIAENILRMLSDREPSELHVRAMDVTLILYAEHEYNASTFTARVVCSTLSDLHSSITAAIGALKGPLHGGANERVMEVLAEVGSAEKAEGWIRKALTEKRRIMGFGHRVYKTGDPRAKYLKPLCSQLADETNNRDMEQTAEVIEQIVQQEKGLPPNLDWPSARLYYYLGLPVELYTPLFVLSRVTGWSAHVIEQLDNNRLIRPRSRYVGPGPQNWLPMPDRKS